MSAAVAKAPRATAPKPGAVLAASNQPNLPQFSKDEELLAFREMMLIRRFEEKAGQLYGMGLIGGFCHLYIGRKRWSSACRWRQSRVIR